MFHKHSMNKSITPSTATPTSLKDRPVLRFVLRAVWVAVAVYIVRMLVVGGSIFLSGWFGSSNLLQQITRLGFNLLTFSTVDIICDIYILLGYFGLASVLFVQRSDDWLGVMTYQLLSGSLPFKRTPPGALLLAHMTTPPPEVRELVPTVTRQTSQAILKAMAKNPDERFPSAREFVQALK